MAQTLIKTMFDDKDNYCDMFFHRFLINEIAPHVCAPAFMCV